MPQANVSEAEPQLEKQFETANVHSENFSLLSSGGNSAADIHSENFCLSKCFPGDVELFWKFCCGNPQREFPQSQLDFFTTGGKSAADIHCENFCLYKF